VSSSSPAAPYTVASDGTLTVFGLQGCVSPDGSFAVLGGGTQAGSDPTIAFLVRR
jgi:hypothetical protein